MNSITFLRGWQGRQAGSIDSRLPVGVMKTLVQFGVACWMAEPVLTAPALISEPEARRRGRPRKES